MKLTSKQRMQAYDILIGEALEEERKEKGMSLQDVANKVGKSKQTIFNYEKGRRSLNTSDFIVYCDKLGFDGMGIIVEVQSKSDTELLKAYSKHIKEHE